MNTDDLTLPVDTAWLRQSLPNKISRRTDVVDDVQVTGFFGLTLWAMQDDESRRVSVVFSNSHGGYWLDLGHVSTRQQFLDLYHGLSSGSLWPPKGKT